MEKPLETKTGDGMTAEIAEIKDPEYPPVDIEFPPVENRTDDLEESGKQNFHPEEYPPVEIEYPPVENKVTSLTDWKQRHEEYPPVEIEYPPVENNKPSKRISTKRGPGRPKQGDSGKPFSPPNYEWRSDSGGWKLVHRPIVGGGKKGYTYIGFLNAKRWNFFKRFNDEKFIIFVTRYFEQRKGGPVRAGRLGQTGG